MSGGSIDAGAADTSAVPCRFCATPLASGARLCTKCGRFQRTSDRLFSGVNLGALTALVPIATLSYAYLNQALIRPYSSVSANVSHCGKEEVVLALANAGTRAAIIDGGTARFTPVNRDYDRGLKPPGEAFTPVVLKPGETLVSRFALVDARSLDTLPAPELAAPAQCRYGITLSVLEFGGRRETVDAGACTC